MCVSARHKGDLLNRMGNVISKTVGEKKKVSILSVVCLSFKFLLARL